MTSYPLIDWVKQDPSFNSFTSDSNDAVPSICVDSNGNSYTCFFTNGTIPSGIDSLQDDIIVFKLDNSGNVVWTKQIPGFNTNGNDQYPKCACHNDELVVAYTTSNSGTVLGGNGAGLDDIILFKLDSTGSILWTYQQPAFNTTKIDTQPDITISNDNSIYLTYSTNGTVIGGSRASGNPNSNEIVVVKITDPLYVPITIWTYQQPGINTSGQDTHPKISTDTNNNIYVAYETTGATTSNTLTGPSDVVVFKLTQNLMGTVPSFSWIAQSSTFNTTASNSKPDIVTDSLGNSYVTYYSSGTIEANTGGNDIIVFKLNTSGNLLWIKQNSNFNTTQSDSYPSIDLDSNNSVYVSYQSSGIITNGIDSGNDDIILFKIDTNGNFIWALQNNIENTADIDNYPSISVKDVDTVYVAFQRATDIRVYKTRGRPIFTYCGPFTVPENSANDTNVSTGQVSAYSGAGYDVTYSIINGGSIINNLANTFAIDSITGQISVFDNTYLDYETYPIFTLTVRATDNGTPQLYEDCEVIINLTNVLDPPSITDCGPYSVQENTANNQLVGTIIVSAPDATSLFYEIINGITVGTNLNNTFSIDQSGNIYVNDNTNLDYETITQFILTIKVTPDNNNLFSVTCNAIIDVENVNESPQLMCISPININENLPNNTVVTTVSATDVDVPTTLTFSIIAGNTNNAFGINNSGQIYVNDQLALDYETNPSFTITVQVSDNWEPVLSNTCDIVINLLNVNEYPFLGDYIFNVNENTLNLTLVGTITAVDPDNNIFSYTILSGNTNNAFSINNSGQIFVNNQIALDYETNPIFNLIVQVGDSGIPSLTDTGTVTINVLNVNEPPILENYIFSINENSTNGTLVGTVTASDPDNNVFGYSIISGNTNNAFSVNNSGQIIVNNQNALDFETTPTFTLTIQVSDFGVPALTDVGTVIINLLNMNEPPIVINFTFNINEHSANGTFVGIVSATDPENNVLSYSISNGNFNNTFSISSLGAITVNNNSQLDYSVYQQFVLTVVVSDGTNNVNSIVTINVININDPPIILPETFTIPENSPNNTIVGTINASDPDNDPITFLILSGNIGNAFTIIGNQIVVNNQNALDYEIIQAYNLVIKAMDPYFEFSTAIYTINITNVNEPPTLNNYIFYLNENSPINTVVGTVVGDDQDVGSILVYDIIFGNTNNTFAINSSTGEITVNDGSILDFETNPVFALKVQVSDNGLPQLFGTGVVTIYLNNVSEPIDITPGGELTAYGYLLFMDMCPFSVTTNLPTSLYMSASTIAKNIKTFNNFNNLIGLDLSNVWCCKEEKVCDICCGVKNKISVYYKKYEHCLNLLKDILKQIKFINEIYDKWHIDNAIETIKSLLSFLNSMITLIELSKNRTGNLLCDKSCCNYKIENVNKCFKLSNSNKNDKNISKIQSIVNLNDLQINRINCLLEFLFELIEVLSQSETNVTVMKDYINEISKLKENIYSKISDETYNLYSSVSNLNELGLYNGRIAVGPPNIQPQVLSFLIDGKTTNIKINENEDAYYLANKISSALCCKIAVIDGLELQIELKSVGKINVYLYDKTNGNVSVTLDVVGIDYNSHDKFMEDICEAFFDQVLYCEYDYGINRIKIIWRHGYILQFESPIVGGAVLALTSVVAGIPV